MAGHSRESDFAATTPWDGIIGKPIAFAPTKHAPTHGVDGDDPVSLAISQIVGLAEALARKADKNITINGQSIARNVTITPASLGLGNVDNTSDMDKPVSIAQQAAIDAAIPSGLIATWSGLLADIPGAWKLCDGTDGTPDLRDKFIKGCAAGIDPGVTGGSELHTPTGVVAAPIFTGTLGTTGATSAGTPAGTLDAVSAGTPAGTNTAPTFTGSSAATSSDSAGTPAGTNANESAHTHSVTASGTNANESTHTHGVTSNVAVADHASHTHTYTDVPNHVHVQSVNSGTTGPLSGYTPDTSTQTSTASGYSTANPTGGVATGTTAGPNAALSHNVTNNAVTSAAGSAHTHTFTGSPVTSGAGSAHTHTFTGSALAGHSHTVTATGTVSAPIFTGNVMGTHTHTFTGSALATHTHSFTPAGTNDAPAFTGDEADFQPEFYTLAFIMKR